MARLSAIALYLHQGILILVLLDFFLTRIHNRFHSGLP